MSPRSQACAVLPPFQARRPRSISRISANFSAGGASGFEVSPSMSALMMASPLRLEQPPHAGRHRAGRRVGCSGRIRAGPAGRRRASGPTPGPVRLERDPPERAGQAGRADRRSPSRGGGIRPWRCAPPGRRSRAFVARHSVVLDFELFSRNGDLLLNRAGRPGARGVRRWPDPALPRARFGTIICLSSNRSHQEGAAMCRMSSSDYDLYRRTELEAGALSVGVAARSLAAPSAAGGAGGSGSGKVPRRGGGARRAGS